jgi:23S rRNA (guanosine2251-2'-O)-methyltransferase
VGRETLEKMAGGQEVRGALLVVEAAASPTRLKEYHEYLEDFDRRQEALVLLLDEITDPQNLGAILRSADLFNVDLVVIPQRRSAHETAAVKVASAGASAYVPTVTVTNLARTMEELKQAGFWIYGAQAGGEAAEKVRLSGKLALVMGSEGKGLRRLVSEGCDGFVSIPMGGHIDSLNVSVAAGILLYEVRRQGRESRPVV